MIRKATLNDVEGILKLIIEFHEESLGEYKLSFDWDTLRETIKRFITHNITIVVDNGEIVGVIAGIISNSIFDIGQKIGQEALWYITKKERKGTLALRLLKTFEQECKDRGADFILIMHMINLNADELNRLYETMDYKPMECHYIKGV